MSTVPVVWTRIRGARRASGGALWVLVRQTGGPALTTKMVDAALEVAVGAAEEAGFEDELGGGDAVELGQGAAVYLSRTGGEAGLRLWAETFARTLADGGVIGEVTAAPHQQQPRWVEDEFGLGSMGLAAFTAYRFTEGADFDAQGRLNWAVPTDATARLTESCVARVLDGPGTAYLRLGTYRTKLNAILGAETPTPMVSAQVAPLLTTALPTQRVAQVMNLDRTPQRYVATRFIATASAVHVHYEPGLPWADRLAGLLDYLRATADLVELAMIRPTPWHANYWDDMEVTGPPLLAASVPGVWYQQRRRELGSTVPDVHGVQLLTSAHLDRAHDLSHWEVEEVAGDRFLVSARNLEQWLRGDGPPAEVLAAGRADFGQMLHWRGPLVPRRSTSPG